MLGEQLLLNGEQQPISKASFSQWFVPLINALKELGGTAKPEDVRSRIIHNMNLSETITHEIRGRTNHKKFNNDVAWARNYLADAGLIDRTTRGVWALTEEGKAIVITFAIFDDIVAKRYGKEKSTLTSDIISKKNIPLQIDAHLRGIVTAVLARNFPNGIRPNSIIDTNKLKSCCVAQDGNISIEAADIPLILENLGVRHGDKVYVVSTENRQQLYDLMQELVTNGNRLFFYSELYDVHDNLLQGMNIFSSQLLKSILQETLPNVHFKSKYCLSNAYTTIEDEVFRCFTETHLLTHVQLKEMLPYIPASTLRQTLSRIGDYINVGRGVYTHAKYIALDEEECLVAKDRLETEISNNTYATLASAELPHSIATNSNINASVVRYGFFQRYLVDKYERRGSIVTLKGTPINNKAAIREFCVSHKRLSLESLTAFEHELTGGFHSVSLFVAYDCMVRVDADYFASDSEIIFDVVATDAAIELFFYDTVIPLQAVTSFTSFPHIEGYAWNWFLLESYCRRFSMKFAFQCLSVNNRNVGALFRKGQPFEDYPDVLAYAVIKANVALNESDVGDFLFEKRYVAARTSSLQKVVQKAQLLSERGVM